MYSIACGPTNDAGGDSVTIGGGRLINPLSPTHQDKCLEADNGCCECERMNDNITTLSGMIQCARHKRGGSLKQCVFSKLDELEAGVQKFEALHEMLNTLRDTDAYKSDDTIRQENQLLKDKIEALEKTVEALTIKIDRLRL